MKSKVTEQSQQKRLDALASNRILNTPSEKEFDFITEVLIDFYNVTNCTISFLTESTVWHKAQHQEVEFCDSLFEILQFELIESKKEYFESSDITKHELFTVDDSKTCGFSFFACAPIIDNHKNILGAICIMDVKPQHLSESKKSRFKDFSAMVAQQLEYRLLTKHYNQYISTQTDELHSALINLRSKVQQAKKENSQIQSDLLQQAEAGKLRSKLVKSLNEQFRSPLTTITTSAQLIEMTNGENNATHEKHLKRILSSVRNISGMMDDVLYLHELDFLNLKADAQEIDVKKLIYRTIEKVKLESDVVQETQVKCLDGEGMKFVGNIDAIELLIRSLSSNAIKFNALGSKIHIEYSVDSHSFQFNINNKGAFIEQNELGKIFELFYKGNNATNKEGIGLGLAIADKIVNTLNGKIKVESSKELGTTFYVLIPTMK